MANFLSKINSLFRIDNSIESLKREVQILQSQIGYNRVELGRIQSKLNLNFQDQILNDIKLAEFKVFSQWGDDGIIQFLINYLDIDDKRFVEFGVESYKECNTRFLLVNNNWEGLVMDGSDNNIKQIQSDEIYWQYNLIAKSAFIASENINDLLLSNGFSGEIGLLHIDIDGNDYWVWRAINVVNPIIVIVEYNSVFGIDKPWTVPYKSDFIRSNLHYSNLYFGASVLSFCDLAKEKGYVFIGCNNNGNNAYFVRMDKSKGLKEKSVADGFVTSKFSESRDEKNQLTFIKGKERLHLIKGLPVFNTRTNTLENIQ